MSLDIEGTLSAHEYAIGHRTGAICLCGFVPTVNPETLATQQDYHRAHVAAVLRDQIDAALAEVGRQFRAAAELVIQDVRAQRGDHIAGLVEDSFDAHFDRAAHLSDTERAES
jgi:hypothetical protein